MLEGFHSIGDILVYWQICEKTYLRSSHRNDYQALTEPLAKLYSYIIEYQARVICHLSRAQLSRAWQNMAGSLDWTRKAGKIDTLDRTCRSYIPPLQDEETRNAKDRQLQVMQESQEILREIRLVLADAGTQTQRLYDDQNERDLLCDLASDWESGKNFNASRVEGTCEWFLNDERFRRWRDSRTSALLWVSAGPGCGKSVLSRSLVDEGRLSTSVATSTVCYFFFKDGEEGRTSEADALSAILHQLFSRQATGHLIRYALSAHKNFGHSLSRNPSELWRILMDCTKSVDAGEIICVLDALDECDVASRNQIINRLGSFYFREQNMSKLKFLITSRPYDDLEASFRRFSATATYIRFDGDDKHRDISHEISLVIDSRLGELACNLSPDDRRKISERLKSMENRTYLWLHLTFSIIEQDPSGYGRRSTIEDLLSDLPTQISGAYENILSRSKNERTTELLLQIILIATRPLTLDEANISLTLALQKERFTSHGALLSSQWPPGNFKTVVKNLCGLFINVYDSKISFIHQTAKEFLTARDQQMRWKGRLSLQASHRTMSLCCLHYLMLPEFNTVKDAPQQQYPFMAYAAPNWAFHFRSQAADQADKNDARELCRVLRPRTQLWRSFLIDQDYNIQGEDWASWPDLTFSSYLGLASIVDYIITNEHVDVNACGGYYRTALYAATYRGYLNVLGILLEPCNKVEITEEVVEIVARNESNGEVIMQLLFEKCSDKVKITEEVVKAAAENLSSGKEIMQLLLEKCGDKVMITEKVVKAAVENEFSGKAIMQLLLEKCGDKVKITEEVVKAAANNRSSGKEIMQLLFEKCGDKVKITKEVVKAAAENKSSGKAIMQLLLEKCGDKVKITEEVVKAAAENESSGKAIMQLLLEKCGDKVKITEEVVKAAVENWNNGEAVIQLLLEKRSDEVKITEEVVKAAAENESSGKAIMQLLLEKCGDKVKITEEVVKATVKNGLSGGAIMQLLLEKCGDKVKITEEVVKATVENESSGKAIMQLLLEKCGDKVMITEKVVKAAAENESSGKAIMQLLLEKCGDKVKITEEVVKAAANNRSSGKAIMQLLLEKCGDKVKITEEVVKARLTRPDCGTGTGPDWTDL